MKERACPVCGPKIEYSIFTESNFDASRLNAFSFSSRKNPEGMHHRLLRCLGCDTLYSSPAPISASLGKAYDQALFDSGEEAQYASRTYSRQLERAQLPDRRGALDIGTGEGAFLERLLEAGFENVRGVEPSSAPIAAAKPEIQKLIRHGVFSARNYRPQSLSLVTCFQTLEHLAEPSKICHESFRLLKPGGVFFTVCHNYRSLSAKILGLKSPIFDIEHMQLFSPESVRALLEKSGFVGIRVYAINNIYPLHYWIKVFPFPASLKKSLISALKATGLGYLPLALPAGNLVAMGSRPASRG